MALHINISGAAKRKEKEKREQGKAKLQKLDTVHLPGDEPNFFVGSDSAPPKTASTAREPGLLQVAILTIAIHNV